MTNNTPYIKLERSEQGVSRIITFCFREDGLVYVDEIRECVDDDDLWDAWKKKYPNVNRVKVSFDRIEECDCLTIREAAEATLEPLR